MHEEQNYWTRSMRRRLSRRTVLKAGGAGAAAMLLPGLAACGSDDSSPSGSSGGTGGGPRSGGTVRQVQPRDLPHLDPHTETYPAGFVVSLVHAGLLRFKFSENPNELQPEPYVAESYEQPEPTTMVLKLRPNVKFHDIAPVSGRAVTAEDVKYSLERIKTDKPEFQRRTFFEAVDSVTAVDERTVRLALKYPFAPLPVYLADTWNAIVPKEIVDRDGDMRKTAVGCGPFTLESYEQGVGVVMKKNPSFFLEGKPYVDEIRMPVLTDPAAILAAFRSQQVDFMRNINFSDVASLKQNSNLQIREYANVDLQYIRINTRNQPLNDPRVRRALSMALNRETLVQTAYQGQGAPAGVFPAGVKGALKPEDLPYYKYNVQEAKNLLQAAGVGNGFKVTNLFPSGSGKQQTEAQVVIDQLRSIGVQVENRTLEYGAYLQAAYSKEFDINIHWGNRYDDPDGYAIEYLTTGGRNFGYWGTKELDDLITKQRQTLDAEERAKVLAEVQKYIANEMYTIGLGNWADFDGWYTKLQNFNTSVHWFRATQQLAEAWLSS